jgi:hypothetical protein
VVLNLDPKCEDMGRTYRFNASPGADYAQELDVIAAAGGIAERRLPNHRPHARSRSGDLAEIRDRLYARRCSDPRDHQLYIRLCDDIAVEFLSKRDVWLAVESVVQLIVQRMGGATAGEVLRGHLESAISAHRSDLMKQQEVVHARYLDLKRLVP